MVGQTVGKYRVEDRIGRGGMGTVYRAVDETLHREVAIKVLNSELNDPEVAKRFRAEAITVARLSHPGIATIYELFEHDGQWLMVMEFVKGETLERLVERAGPLSAERAAELAMQALGALAHAHSLGVVHRDLKPANLMLTESGAVKIMDFGIARVSGSEHLTNVGFMMGTPAYMAPEQVLSQEVDSRADLYAMGVVIYRLTTGRLPFKGETPFALAQSQVNDPPTPIRLARQGLPEWLEQVITVALAKSPGDRFQSAQEFHATLQRCLAGLPMTMPTDVTAPTGMMLTPPGLPTGVLTGASGALRASGALPMISTGAMASAAGPGTSGVARTASGSMPALSEMPTQMHSTAGLATGTGPATGVTVAPPGPPASGAGKSPKLSTSTLAMAGVAAVLVVGAGAAFLWSRRQPPAPPPAAVDVPAVTAPAVPPVDAPAPADPAASAAVTPAVPPKPEPPAPAPSRGAAAAPAASPSTSAPTKPEASITGASAAAGGAPPAAPPIDDSFHAFKDVKFMAVKGNDTQDEDALLNLGTGHITVVPKDGGSAFASMAYSTVAKATYAHMKDPKWDAALPSPPDNLNIHGFMRGARHWLMLQSKTGFTLLRLDDSNWREVIDAIEARCGLKVERLTDGSGQ